MAIQCRRQKNNLVQLRSESLALTVTVATEKDQGTQWGGVQGWCFHPPRDSRQPPKAEEPGRSHKCLQESHPKAPLLYTLKEFLVFFDN